VLEIVHFCLGEDEDFRVPTGVISDLVVVTEVHGE
jgi:hypothetical protein